MHFSRRRHVWVRFDFGVEEYPGLVLEWLDDPERARVMYVKGEKVLTEVVPRFNLRVVDAQPNIGSAYG